MTSPGFRYFSQFLKDDLQIILEFFGEPLPKHAKKAQLVELVSSYICTRPVEWLFQLPERDLVALRDIINSGRGRLSFLEYPEYPTILEALHIMLAEDGEEGTVQVEIDPSIYDAVAPFIDQVIRDREKKNDFYYERIIVGIINFYGIIEMGAFVDTIIALFPENGEVPDDFLQKICGCPALALLRFFREDEVFFVSPFVEDPEALLNKRSEYGSINDYAPITIEEAYQAGLFVPTFSPKSPGMEKDDLYQMLKELGYDELGCRMEMNDIWTCSQNPSDETMAENLYGSINDCIDDIPTFTEYCRFAGIISAYANSIPKWVLKGHSADETGELKIVNEAFEDEGTIAFPDGESVGVAAARLPKQDSLNDFFRYGIAVKHASPDAPCPCGSGLKYRNCHGKLLN